MPTITEQLTALQLGPSPVPGWLPADTLHRAAELIAVEVGAFRADRPDLAPLKALCWQLVHNLDGAERPTPHAALVAHLAAEVLHTLADHRR